MKGKNNFEPMNFLSPQGQIIPFIKVLVSYYMAFKIYFYQRSRATPLGEPSVTAREVVMWEEAHSSTRYLYRIDFLLVEGGGWQEERQLFLLTLGTSDARVECRGRMNSPLS
jgi:hypothetical protein